MPSPRFAFALFAAAVAAPLSAAPRQDSAQPEFQPLRAKNSSSSPRVEKPKPAQAAQIEVKTEMRAVLGADGRVRLECSDASHAHEHVAPMTAQETE